MPIPFADIVSRAIPAPDYVVASALPESTNGVGLLVAGDVSVIYAEWGGFKTTYAAHLGLHIANGTIELGPFTIPKTRRVYLVTEEMSESRMRRLVQRLAVGAQVAERDLPFLIDCRPGTLFTESDIPRLLKLVKEAGLGPGDVLIFDSLRRGLVGSESDQKDMTEFWRVISKHLVPLGLTMIFLHHCKKPRGKALHTRLENLRNEYSGSTDVIAAVDNAIGMLRDPSDRSLVHIAQQKGRDGEFPLFTVRFDFDGQTGPIRVYYDSNPEEPELQPTSHDVVLAWIIENPGCKATEIIAKTRLAERTVYDALQGLESRTLIQKDGKPKGPGGWTATASGKRELDEGFTYTRRLIEKEVAGPATGDCGHHCIPRE